MTRGKRVCILLAIVAALILAVLVIVFAFARAFVAQEHEVRSVWRVDVGELLGQDEALELAYEKKGRTARVVVIPDGVSVLAVDQEV